MNVKEDDFPEKYRDLIRRLQKAVSEPDIRNKMDAEDDIIEALADLEREKEYEKEFELAKKDLIINENIKTIEEKEKTIEEKEKTIEEKEKILKDKDKLIAELQQKLKKRK